MNLLGHLPELALVVGAGGGLGVFAVIYVPTLLAGFVAWPVDGPLRCTSTTTQGVSVMHA